MNLRTSAPERPLLTWLAVVVVAVIVGLPIFAMTLQRWGRTPDAGEHLLSAHQGLNGSGVVVPVQWHYYLDPPPPHPAIWSRAPLISLLAALPLALGASVSGVALLHAALAGGVAGGVVRFATRIMTLPCLLYTSDAADE